MHPVQACLVFESLKAGTFEVALFHDGKFEEYMLREGLEYEYWPSEINLELNSLGRIIQFGKNKKKTLAYSQFKRSIHRDVCGAVLQFILTNDNFKNTTVVTQSSQELISISSALLEDQITPQVLRTDNTILEVGVKDCNLRFIDINCFQGPNSHRDLVKLIYPEQKPIFFLENLNTNMPVSYTHLTLPTIYSV